MKQLLFLLALISSFSIVGQSKLKSSVAMTFVDGGINEMIDSKRVDTIPSFYISTYEVTQKEWKEIMNSNPSMSTVDSYPVECVSWFAAIRFCNKLSKKDGYQECYKIEKGEISRVPGAKGYRLPSVAEWEFAAKGGNRSKGYKYAGGNSPEKIAWFSENANNIIHSVGDKDPNELGIYDMSGNVWEWCEDILAHQNDDKSGMDPARICCGGSWGDSYKNCKIGSRIALAQGAKDPGIGIRLILEP